MAAASKTIVHVVTSGEVAGGQVVALELARAARQRGHEVHFVSPTDGPFLREARAEGFPTYLIDVSRTFRLRGLLALIRLLRRLRADVVHTHTHVAASVLGRVAGRAAGAKIVSHLHIENHYRKSSLPRALLRSLDNATARLCTRVVSVSDATREAFVAQGYPARLIEVVHNGVEMPAETAAAVLRPELGLGTDAPLVGEVARLAPVKGQRELIEAIALVPGAALALVGDDLEQGGAYRRALEALTEELGVRERVSFCGYRRGAAELIGELDALVLPSHSEGLPIVVLEAMVRGVPVVATPVGGTAELVLDGETGVLVPPGDVAALAEALRRLLANRELARRLGEAGRARALEHFTLEAQQRRMLEIYEEIA